MFWTSTESHVHVSSMWHYMYLQCETTYIFNLIWHVTLHVSSMWCVASRRFEMKSSKDNFAPKYLTKIWKLLLVWLYFYYMTIVKWQYSKCRFIFIDLSSFVTTVIILWYGIPIEIRILPTLKSFQKCFLSSISRRPSYFSYGARYWNVIHTRIRKKC